MSELTKQQLTVENNSSFPNNNTGFITPTLLRTFNGNIIDSMVDEVTYNADSASWTSDIAQLEQFSASLDANFVSTAELNASSSTLQNNINTKLNTSSFNAYTASQEVISASFNSRINSVTGSSGDTGSLLLTASAAGNVITFTKGNGSTFPVTIATGSGGVSGDFVTTSSFNAYTQSAASGVSASINAATSSLSSSLSASIGALSSSVAVTNLAQSQSIAQLLGFSSSLDTTFATDAQLSASASTLQNDINTRVLTSSFQTYTSSVSTQIAALGTNKVNYNSPVNPQTITGSLIISGTSTNGGGESLQIYGKGDGVALHVYSGSVQVTSPQGTGYFYTNLPITSSGARINGLARFSGIEVIGLGGASGSGSLFVENDVTASNISASQNIYANTVFATVLNGTASFATNAATASFLLGSVASASFATSASFAQTASIANNVVVNATNGNASTLNKGTVVRITGANGDNPVFNSASWDNDGTSANTLGILQNNVLSGATGSIVVTGIVIGVDTDAFSAGDVLYLSASGQFTNVQPQAPRHIVTLGEVLRVQQNNGSIFVNISNGWELDELHNVRITNPAQGNLLAYNSASRLWENSSSIGLGLATTGSNTFIGNQTITGSVILSSSADIELTVIGNTIISGNLVVTGSNINLEVTPPDLSVGVTNVKTLLDATASGVVTSTDITRLGAGPTGDLSGIRLQTLSGSDTTGDTLLSRINTGVNRHTSTAMTGSVVNTSMVSTWATGSAGTRVSYTSQVNANAQSASATLTLAAGNLASNYAGGTASLQAGRINIGATGATINITGSNPNILSGSLSGSLISNLGDIYTGSNNANFIVTLGSASMASLLAGSATNANTLYFVI
jgi:hypothetical protein